MERKILLIDACVRDESRTRRLACRVLEHLGGTAETVSLRDEHIVPLDNESLERRTQLQAENRCIQSPPLHFRHSVLLIIHYLLI